MLKNSRHFRSQVVNFGGGCERFFGFSLNQGTEILGRRKAFFLCKFRFWTIWKNNPYIDGKTT